MNKPTDFATSMTKFFTFYQPSQRNLSQNTIRSYADTFSLLLDFCESQQGIPSEKLTLEKVSMEVVEAFMFWIETERKNSPSTRRQRLTALHSFFRFMQKEEPQWILPNFPEKLYIGTP
jgi:site-specific recombinase XerD